MTDYDENVHEDTKVERNESIWNGSASLVEIRRDLHAHPEAGWKEFRTTALAATELDRQGFTIHLGDAAVAVDERLGVPDDRAITAARHRAYKEGVPEGLLKRMGDVTGLVAERTYGDGTGPVVGIRIDMDALERVEARDESHKPFRDGFVSRHPEEMHACGHDGHTAIGIGLARQLDASDFDGTLKLFFQPAEEGGRGAIPMSRSGHVDGVDYFAALHLGLGNETGKVIAGYDRPLCNCKFLVRFTGQSAHAGNAPQTGANALQAATTAIQNLYAIPRHSAGASRVNVGKVSSPNGQNVISDHAEMMIEVRGETTEINEYMMEKSNRIVTHSAEMHGVSYDIETYGKTTTFESDEEMVASVSDSAAMVDGVTAVSTREQFGASEDASYLIKRVQEQGGKATYIGIGSDHPDGHHTPYFDIDETSIQIAVDVLIETVETVGTR
ncbi:amidohydrolase [Haladaptatus caseinilyticus]|uniref:amidohydrolase n=1 Tax=Haladaptatus caseinilyticus TaxID=2993314 RepID=UPI00224B0D0F|nr:amidohydrolase [Haladaptatus caseinilyticus]